MNFKIILIFLICLYAIITILFFNLYKSIALNDAKTQAENILNNMIEIRMYIKNYLRPAFNKAVGEDKNLKNFDSILLSSNHMTNSIYYNNVLKNNLSYEYKLASTNPLNPINLATKFEETILQKFIDNKKMYEYSDIINEGLDSYFLLAKPIERISSSCLQCHGNPNNSPKDIPKKYGTLSGYNYQVGDLNAMLYIKIPLYNILKKHTKEFFWGGFAMFLAFIIIAILIYLILKKDKTLQKKKESLFSHQNRLAVMGNMIGNISHQWKQPLTHLSNIFINLELQSERGKLTHEKLGSKIQDANEQIKFMSTTIDDFRNFFAPKDPTKTSNIRDIIDKTQNLWRASLLNNEINLQIEIKENFIIQAPKNAIIQIFINILSNAKDAFIENHIQNRIIEIKSYKQENKNIVTISNNGGNIQKANIEDIFQEYFTTKETDKGTGIGLYMSSNIMKTHGGNIKVANTSDGVIFTLEFNKQISHS